MEVKKENAKKILPGMFVYASKNVEVQQPCIAKKVDGIVLLVTDEYVCVDTGKEVFGDVTECQQMSAGETVLSTDDLRKVFARVGLINKGCRFLNWPEWDSWYWGDALYEKTKPDGTPAESVDMCHGGYGWPHQSKGTDGKLLIPKAKVRFVKKIYF